ncbi:hypothetical protein HELRODRAFT_92637 [Helobdella robusta]|uniref:Prospero domain-containing protein n=1 Tax=Helobdella robusta TaxID=6412 RepID=T1G8J3_HELRO|nr:hypothetical protein HELRODRAFT_92637 [Helobdella robusta]ESO00525.1 hypothetical protein HELRODRAFT_92637 [Helobdella robusta]
MPRYPSSSILKAYFPDVLFNKNNTAQLIKWFSNFRFVVVVLVDVYVVVVNDGVLLLLSIMLLLLFSILLTLKI